MRNIAYSKAALKTLRRMQPASARRITEAVRLCAAAPEDPVHDVRRLQGVDGLLRLRMGDWRVLFSDDGTVVAVTRIGPRGDVYGGL
jgi:mRNA interferase RelE/StbE